MSAEFTPWADAHSVQVESEPVCLWRWWCETCGAEESGYLKLDGHATNAHRGTS